jgi:hypothetical protein
VEEEHRINKAIGERIGCWKGGVLVENDAGSLKKALEEYNEKGTVNGTKLA